MASETIGKYRLLERIAEGGMAEIFLCESTGAFEKRFVMKRIHPSLARDKAFVDMFLDEVRVAASLEHTNLAQVFDSGTEGGTPYFVMELLRGHDLSAIETELGTRPMPTEHIVTIATGVLAGLHHAHERRDDNGRSLGLVHRDVSPHNVFVTLDGGVKLCDFGIAKSARQSVATDAGTVKGKLRYLSPEQARAEVLDRRSDIFALSVVLWELLTGRERYTGTDYEILKKVGEEPAPLPSSVRPVPPGLESIVMRGLQLRREDRFGTAQEMQLAIEAWARNERVATSAVGLGAWVRELLGEPLLGSISVESDTGSIEALTSQIERPSFRLPQKLELTGVGRDEPADTPVSRASVSVRNRATPFSKAEPILLEPVKHDEPALELDRPAPTPPPPPPAKKLPVVPIVAVLVLGVGGFFGYRTYAERTRPGADTASIDLVNVPPRARLLLDGSPIEGTHLVLQRSTERHAVQVSANGKPPHVVPFVVDGDKTIDVSK